MRTTLVASVGIHVSDIDRSIAFYRKVLGLKVTGRWGPPDFGRPTYFMRINDKHHDVVLFELLDDVKKAGIASVDSRIRKAPGIDYIAFEVDSREDWLLALNHVPAVQCQNRQWSLYARPGVFRRMRLKLCGNRSLSVRPRNFSMLL